MCVGLFTSNSLSEARGLDHTNIKRVALTRMEWCFFSCSWKLHSWSPPHIRKRITKTTVPYLITKRLQRKWIKKINLQRTFLQRGCVEIMTYLEKKERLLARFALLGEQHHQNNPTRILVKVVRHSFFSFLQNAWQGVTKRRVIIIIHKRYGTILW